VCKYNISVGPVFISG